MAPDFTVQHILDNAQVSLDQHKGKLIYLDFWASWCSPCLKSFPFMNELQEQYRDDGLVVIAVNLDKDNQDALDFLKGTPVSFFVGQDTLGKLATDYDVKIMPSTYLIGRDGQIKEVHHGFKSSDKDRIKQLITSHL